MPGATTPYQVEEDQIRIVPSGRDTSPEAVTRSRGFGRDKTDTDPSLRQPPARSDRARQSGRVQRAVNRRADADRLSPEQRANVDAATRGRDVAAEAGGSVRQQTDRLTPKDLRESNFELDGSGRYEQGNVGYRLDPAKGSAGRPSALQSIPKAIKDQITREFQQTTKGGAVIGTRGRARTPYVIKAGDKLPSADYVRRRANELIGQKNAANAQQSAYRELPPNAPNKPRSGRVRSRLGEKSDDRRTNPQRDADTAERNRREGVSRLRGRRGSTFQESSEQTPSRLRSQQQSSVEIPASDEMGNAPQHHQGRKSRYEPPRRYSNESSERYQERMRGRRGQGLVSLEEPKLI